MTTLHDGEAFARAQDRAQARAEARLRLYKHAALAAGLTLLFLAINLLGSRDYWWFLWPSGAVWLSVGIHALKLKAGGRAWERLRRRLVEEELEKERRGNGQ